MTALAWTLAALGAVVVVFVLASLIFYRKIIIDPAEDEYPDPRPFPKQKDTRS